TATPTRTPTSTATPTRTPTPTNTPTPTFAASPSTVLAGSAVTAQWTNVFSASNTDVIGLVRSTDPPGAGTLSFVYASSCTTVPASPPQTRINGSCSVPVPSSLSPGTYLLRYYIGGTNTILLTSNAIQVNQFAQMQSVNAAAVFTYTADPGVP